MFGMWVDLHPRHVDLRNATLWHNFFGSGLVHTKKMLSYLS